MLLQSHFAWAPDGQHFYAATTAPRLRINNCYRIFHYTGKLKREVKYDKEELWEVLWSPSYGNYEKFAIVFPKAGSVARSNAQTPENRLLEELPNTKASVYLPPALRNKKSNNN